MIEDLETINDWLKEEYGISYTELCQEFNGAVELNIKYLNKIAQKDEEIERLNKEHKEFINLGIEDERTIDRLKYKLNKIEESAKFADLIYSTHLLEIIGDEELETNEEYFKDCLNDLKSIYESLCCSAPEMIPVFLGQMKEIFDDIEENVGDDEE